MKNRVKSAAGQPSNSKMRTLSFALVQVFGAGMAAGLAVAPMEAMAQAQQVEKLEITGSRVKRAEVEGALPVTVITRQDLEASGQATVAEFIRNVPYMSVGAFRPQSGSSAQGYSGVDLRGLGDRRTLVLIDGRRIAKSPTVGDSVDMNSVPLAAVERIEILTDGASAIYGSEAIGGVINIITRKTFEGVAVNYKPTKVSLPRSGGDREEGSAILGLSGDKGRILMGASFTNRDIIYQRDAYPAPAPGASSFSNNYFRTSGSFITAVPNGCNDPLFYTAGGRCRYDFTSAAADEAELGTKAFFARGEYNINADWTAFMTTTVTRQDSFGRYAPVPGFVQIDPGSAAHPWTPGYPDPSLQSVIGQNETILLGHRFAAGGNRDTTTDNTLYDTLIGVKGRFMGADVEGGLRKSTSKFFETGRGYVIETLARAQIYTGAYNIFAPSSTPSSVLNSFTATVGREGLFDQTEQYVNGTIDTFKLKGGVSRLYLGYEQRKEVYEDIYDSLSEAGVVLGSAGNSAAGSRKVKAFSGEWVFPFTKELEGTVAGRWEKYSDYGNDFSPKVSLRWAPRNNITLRASAGEGFAAPSLPALYTKPAFSAESIVDEQHCLADGNSPAVCATNPEFQINGTSISNPELTSEKSKQWSFGGTWDATNTVSLRADYWNIKIDDVISFVGAQSVIDRSTGVSPLPIPAGLSITRDTTGFITEVIFGYTNEGTLKTDGVDMNVVWAPSFGKWGRLRSELTWSHTFSYDSDGVELAGVFAFPDDRATWGNRWTLGSVDAAWNINYIGAHGDKEGRYAGGYTTHDLQLGWNTPLKGTKLIIGAVNAFEKKPALVDYDGRAYNYYLYDGYGRQGYIAVEVKL